MPKPTYSELGEFISAQAAEIEMLKAEIAGLCVENAMLKSLAANSTNLSRPPSGWLSKPEPKSLRKKSGLSRAGTRGHPGSTLAQIADPDEVVVHERAV